MKPILISIVFSVCLLQACESTGDTLDTLDHTVPSVQFNPDTIEVIAGEGLSVNSTIGDESGIQRIEFAYGNWRINEIVDLTKDSNPVTYKYSTHITVPADALKEWQEEKYFNDGTSIKILQQYHKLALSGWDINRNMNKGYLYVKVK